MKKIFGALMIAICIAMAMPAQAQIHFGVKGGLNLSKASFSNVSENFKKDNFTGFFIGPMAEFNIPIVGLGVDASLLFAQRGIKVSEGNDDITVKQNGIDIPVNLKLAWEVWRVFIWLQVLTFISILKRNRELIRRKLK